MVNFLDKFSVVSGSQFLKILNDQDSHYLQLSLFNYPRAIQVIQLVTINIGVHARIYEIQENHVNFS